MMGLVLGIIFCAVLAAVVVGLLEYFSSDRRALRASGKSTRQAMASQARQLQAARKALTKIAANDAGNPVLEAQLALEAISSIELKELES